MTMGDEDCHQDHVQDHHSAAIELSNSCRKFYFNHVKTTEEFKKSVSRSRRHASKPNGTVKSRLDAAMDKLRTEMVSRYGLVYLSEVIKLTRSRNGMEQQQCHFRSCKVLSFIV